MSLTKMRRNMHKAIRPVMYVIAFVFVASCFTWYWPTMGPGAGQAAANDAIVARVDGQEIDRVFYERNVQLQTRQMEMMAQLQKQQGGGGPSRVDLRQYHLAR